MWKKFAVYLLALVALYASFDVYGAESKREKQRKKSKQTRQSKKSFTVSWQNDITKALALAKKSKQPILLVHYAPQVTKESKQLHQSIVMDKNLGKAARGMVLVKFEYTDLRKISKEAAAALKKYPIEQRGNKFILPTVYLLDSAGNILDRKSGFSNQSSAGYLKSFKGLKRFRKK